MTLQDILFELSEAYNRSMRKSLLQDMAEDAEFEDIRDNRIPDGSVVTNTPDNPTLTLSDFPTSTNNIL